MSARLPSRRSTLKPKLSGVKFIGINHTYDLAGALSLPPGTLDGDIAIVGFSYNGTASGLGANPWESSTVTNSHGYPTSVFHKKIGAGGVAQGLTVSGATYSPIFVAVYRGAEVISVIDSVDSTGNSIAYADAPAAAATALARVATLIDRNANPDAAPPAGYTVRSAGISTGVFSAMVADDLEGLPGSVSSPAWTGFPLTNYAKTGFLLELRSA